MKKKVTVSIELAHKGQRENAFLLVYGGYLKKTGPIAKAIKKAGWSAPAHPASRIPAKFLEEYTQTEEYNQPGGTGLFGGSTKAEGRHNITRLRDELHYIGVDLPTWIREMTLGELL